MTYPTDPTSTARLPGDPPELGVNGASQVRPQPLLPVSGPYGPTGQVSYGPASNGPALNGPALNAPASNGPASAGPGSNPGTGAGLSTHQAKRLALVAVLLVIVGAGVGFIAALLTPTQYAARAELIYEIRTEQPTGFLREDRNLTTQQLLLESRTILEPIAAANGLAVEDLTKKVKVTITDGSEIINLEVRDHSPETALALLNAIDGQYLDRVNGQGKDAKAYLEQQLAQVADQLSARNLSGSEAAGLATRRSDLSGQLDQLNVLGPQAGVFVAPYNVKGAVSASPLVVAGIGALAGILVAAVVVGLVARRWTARARA